MKATKTVTATVHGVEGEGRNATEAKAAAIARLEAATDGDYRPVLLRFNAAEALVWRELDGWRYRIIHQDDYGCESGLFAHCLQEPQITKAALIVAAKRHLAQIGWIPGQDDEAIAYVDAGNRGELARWLRFQNAYRRFKAEGKSDMECHELACRAA